MTAVIHVRVLWTGNTSVLMTVLVIKNIALGVEPAVSLMMTVVGEEAALITTVQILAERVDDNSSCIQLACNVHLVQRLFRHHGANRKQPTTISKMLGSIEGVLEQCE